MSGLIPLRPWGGGERSDRPEPRLQGVLSEAERLARWEVRAAQWRALELAQAAFGPGVRGTLVGVRHEGPMRGLLRLDVPFESLERHREMESVFLGLVDADPLMSRVPLLFVVGPDAA